MNKRPLCTMSVLLLLVLSILLRFLPQAAPPNFEEGQQIIISGIVIQKEFKNQKHIIYLSKVILQSGSDSASTQFMKSKQQSMVYLEPESMLPAIGSTVTLAGTYFPLEPPSNPGQFDLAKYYASRNIVSRITKGRVIKTDRKRKLSEDLYRLRCHIQNTYELTMDERTAGVISAMVLGDKSQLDNDLKGLFQRNGISHILAISGLHISLLGMGLYRLLKRLGAPLKITAFFCAVFMLSYGFMTGMGVSTYRALLMFLLSILAEINHRTYDLMTALSFSMVWVLMEQPLYLYDAGFLLSFAAVAGIGILYPILQKYPFSSYPILRLLLPGWCIFLTTLPINLWFFFGFSPYSFLLNLLVIPCMGLLFPAAILTALLGQISLQAANVTGWICELIIKLYERGCLLCEKLPGSFWVTGRPAAFAVVLYYVILIVVILVFNSETVFKKKEWKICFTAAGFLVLSGFLMTCNDYDGLRIVMMDTGQGEAILMQYKGMNCLIDGGSTDIKNVGTYRIEPCLRYYGIDTLHYIFVSHSDEDHISGVRELMERSDNGGVNIKKLVLPVKRLKEKAYMELEQEADKYGVVREYMKTGDRLQKQALQIQCLSPGDNFNQEEPNAASMVLSVQLGGFRGLLTGDIEGAGEDALLSLAEQENITCQLLKVAHHGSKNSTPDSLLKLLSPKLALISCGKNNRYGHPHKELMARLKEQQIQTLITKDSGAIILLTKNGEKLSVKQFCKEKFNENTENE